MSVTVEYPLGITGLTLTVALFDDANGDAAAAASLSLTENTSRTGYYSATTSALTTGHTYWAKISGGVVDSTFAIAPASGKMKLVSLAGHDWQTIINGTTSTPNTNAAQINGVTTSFVTAVNAIVGTSQALTFDSNNYPKVSLYAIMGSLLTGTAAYIAAAFSSAWNVATSYWTAADKPQTGDSFAITNSGTYGNNALLTAIQNVQNGTFISATIPQELQTPTASSVTIMITVVFANETGQPQNLDSGNPTATLTNDAGTDRSARLGSWSNPQTGVYTIPYTSSSSDPLEGLHWMVSGTINSKSRLYPAYTQVVNTISVDFTATDRANLASVLTQATAAANQTTSTAMQGAFGLTSANLNSQFATVESAIAALPSAATIQSGLATHTDATTIEAAIAALPSVATIQSGLATHADAAAIEAAVANLPSASQVASVILKTPNNLLATNSDGSVSVNGGSFAFQNNIVIPAAVAQASQLPSQITCIRGDTLSVALPLMGDITSRTKLIFTAKLSVNDTDSEAILQVVEGTGLVISNGTASTSPSSASLTVSSSTTGAVTLVVDAAISSLLSVEDLVWDGQAFLATGIVTPISGTFSVVGDVTRTIT